MRIWRKIWRLAACTVWFGVITFLALPGMFIGRRGIRWNGKVSRLWGAGLVRILNITIERHGMAPGSFLHGLIVSNHQSYLDIIIAGSVLPVRFLPKAEIRHWPVLGWFLALNRPVWIDRKSRLASAEVADEMTRSLQEGLPVLVYAEGTTSDGTGLLPFKSTAFEAVARSGQAVCPLLIRYAPSADGYPAGWYGNMPLLPHVWHTLGQPGFRVRMDLLEKVIPAPGEHRKDLANRVRQIMLDHYRSM